MGPEILLIGLIVGFLITMIYAVVNVISFTRRATEVVSESKSYAYRYPVSEIRDGILVPDLQSLYMEKLKERGSLVKYSREMQRYCTDQLLLMLEDYYDELKLIGRYTDKLNRLEFLYMEAKKDEDIVYIELDNRLVNISAFESPEDYKINDFIVIIDEHGNLLKNQDISKKEKVFSTIFTTHVLKMVYPANRQIKDEIMTDLLEKTVLSYKKTSEIPINPITLHSIRKRHGMYVSEPVKLKPYLNEFSDEMIDIHYGNCDFVHKGETLLDVPVSKIIKCIILGIDDLQNSAIFGPKGVGKSTVQGILTHKLVQNPDYRVYEISSEVVREFSNMEFQAFLDTKFADLAEDYVLFDPENPVRKKNIMVIDEAHVIFLLEKDPLLASVLIQMMDGACQRKYNLCWISVYNTPQSKLMGDLFRDGRTQNIVNLKPLNADKARELGRWIDSKIDQSKYYFNFEQLEKGLESEQYVDSDLQAGIGYLAQSYIFNCVKSRKQASELEAELTKSSKTASAPNNQSKIKKV